MLPPFLQSIPTSSSSHTYPYIAEYTHSERLGRSAAHCLWWPCKNSGVNPNTVLLFVPGNPGLADFYKEYLSYIYQAAPDSLAILAHSLLGHSPHVVAPPLLFSTLDSQIEGIIEAIDDLDVAFGSDTKVMLIGHSVGSWIVLQTLRERSNRVTAVFLLFPTITHIVRTPNGDRLSWLFYGYIPRILAIVSRIFRIIPKRTLQLLFKEWPVDQIDVLWSFLNSPSAILASLIMAHQEMNTIKDLDIEHFSKVKHKLYFFFAEKDDWVGANRETILRHMSDEPHSVRVVHGSNGIPHAYCINHGKELGEQTLQWLQDNVFSLTSRTEVSHK